MKLVIIESPFAGDTEMNLKYLRDCLRDSFMNGEAPFASHGLYTQPGVLNDALPLERELGMLAGFAWGELADVTVVYTDLGITSGMKRGIEAAIKAGRKVVYRRLRGGGGRHLVP